LWMGGRTGFSDTIQFKAASAYDQIAIPWQPVIASHVLAFLHTGVLACVACVLALRVPLMTNILVCFALFVVGHLLAGMGVIGAGIVPALSLYNVDDAVQLANQSVSVGYLLSTALYSLIFAAGSLLIGYALFQRQDIP
jgi:hypothetical protein